MHYSTSMFIGETSRGVPQPVFWDPHTPIFNNYPPGAVITGGPGSGKTHTAMDLVCINATLGKTMVVLDPKGDFSSLIPLRKSLGIEFWNLADRRQRGVLDPFYLAEDDTDRLNLAVTVVDMLIGGLSNDQTRVLSPVVKDVLREPAPSLMRVMETLQISESREARNLGTQLDLVSRLRLADLCFAPGDRRRAPVDIHHGVKIITMAGVLNLNDDSNSGKSRLASTVMFLVTDLIRRIMYRSGDKTTPKMVLIDEAWAVLSTPAGASVIKELLLMGRSLSLATILTTQSTAHLDKLESGNTISTFFAFRTNEKEASSIIKEMQLPPGEGFEGVLTSLSNGECLMQDFTKRYATVQIEVCVPEWRKAFETNPAEKARRAKAKRDKQHQQAQAR